MNMDLKNMECVNTNYATIQDRLERAFTLADGVSMLSDLIEICDNERRYSPDDIANVIKSMVRGIEIEVLTVEETLEELA